MTSDINIQQTGKRATSSIPFNVTDLTHQEISRIRAEQKKFTNDLENILTAPNPHLPRTENKPDLVTKTAAFFAGDDIRFVEKKDKSMSMASALGLGITITMGTIAFSKYLIAGAFTSSVGVSVAVAGLGLLLWYNDRALMQTLEKMKLQNNAEYQKLMAELERDTSNLGKALKSGDLTKSYQSAKSGLFSLANAASGFLAINRLALIAGGAALMSTAAIDKSGMGIGEQVDIELGKGFGPAQQVIDPNDGITTQAEILADIKSDSAEYGERITVLTKEKADLQRPLAGYELNPSEQSRLEAINAQIAKFEQQKALAQQRVIDFAAEMKKEADGLRGATTGEGTLWRKAKGNMELEQGIVDRSSKSIASAEAQRDAITEGAKTRAAGLRDEQFVASSRARVTEIDREITDLQTKITARANPEDFAKSQGIWPEFNPDGLKRFDPIWQKVLSSGSEVKIVAGMMVMFWSGLEAMALLQKLNQKNPHSATIKKAMFEAYESHRNIRAGLLRTAIGNCDAEIIAVRNDQFGKDRALLSASRDDANAVGENAATHSRAIMATLPGILSGDANATANLSRDDKTKALELAEQVRKAAHEKAQILVAKAELDALVEKSNLHDTARQALAALDVSMKAANDAVTNHMNGSSKMHVDILKAASDAQQSLHSALKTLGNDPALSPLKEALQKDFEGRMKTVADTIAQTRTGSNDNGIGQANTPDAVIT